jgi:DHA1 family tetracycline resistance protein-like MFS transporter
MNKKSPLAVLFFTTFLDLVGFGIIIPILPNFAKDLGASAFEVGLLAAVYALMNFLFSPFWGTLSDRIGRRPVIMYSVALTAVAHLIFSQSYSLGILLFSRILAGVGSANISAAQAYITDISEPKNRAKSLGLIGAAFGLGFIFGPPLGGYVKDTFGFEWVGYMAGALSFINLILVYFFLPESLKEKKPDTPFSFRPVSNIYNALQKPLIRELFLINFIYIAAFSMMQITAALLWKEHSNLSDKDIGYVFAFIGVCSALIQGVFVGKFTDRFGEKKLLVMGNFSMAIGLLAMPFFNGDLFMPWEFVVLLLIALSNGFVGPSLASLLSQKANPGELGQTLGLNQSFGSLARVVGPTLGGFLYGIEFHLPYVFGAAILMFSLYLALTIFKERVS